jgi:hypothetical protein
MHEFQEWVTRKDSRSGRGTEAKLAYSYHNYNKYIYIKRHLPSKRIQSTVRLRQKVFLYYRLSSWVFGIRFPCHFVWSSWFVSCRAIRSCYSLRLRKCPPPTCSSFSIFVLAQYINQLRGFTSSVCRDEVICITFPTFTWSKGLF